MNGNAEAVYWADTIGKPDIYIVVAIEGHGEFLIPRITYGYSGQPILDNLFEKYAKPGSKICIYVFDDDSFSNDVWNSILQTRIALDVTSKIQATPAIGVTIGAKGNVQLLNRNTALDTPDFVAYAEFLVPESNDGGWIADGTLIDQKGIEVGKIQFSEIWKANVAEFEQAVAEGAKSKWSMYFWIGMGIVLVIVFASQFTTVRL
jgi:hypothetical protein